MRSRLALFVVSAAFALPAMAQAQSLTPVMPQPPMLSPPPADPVAPGVPPVAVQPAPAPGITAAQAMAVPARAADEPDPNEIRRACEGARGLDAFAWTSAAILAATGIGLTVGTAVVTGRETPPAGYLMVPVTPEVGFLRSFSPGLILGAIGVPFARGAVAPGIDAYRGMCARVEANGRAHREDARDNYAADQALRIHGAPGSPIVTILLAVASGASVAGTIVAFAVNSTDLAQIMGGIDAAAVAGWAFVIPTPPRLAAEAYVQGRYRSSRAVSSMAQRVFVQPLASPIAGGTWLGVGGTF